MRGNIHIYALSKFFVIFVCFFLIQMASGKEIIRLTAGEWPPYISETLDHSGLIAQITEEAFALQGIEMKLGFFPWERAAHLSKTGEWDGTIAYSKTLEREQIYFFSDPIYIGKYVFFHLKTLSLKWKQYSDLSKLRIAAPRGFGGMGKEFLSAEEKKVITVDRVTTILQAFNMLLLGRVQIVPSDLDVGYVLLKQKFDKKKIELITHSDHVIKLARYHLVMPKSVAKSPELIKKFNLGLRTLKRSGRYNQIIKDFYQKKIYQESLPATYLMSEMDGLKKNPHSGH